MSDKYFDKHLGSGLLVDVTAESMSYISINEVFSSEIVGSGFDIIATNPPFAGDISNDDTLTQYELAYKLDKKGKRKKVNKLGKEKLFIERCLNMLVPGGRMAIVLPRGIMKNYSDERIRRYIMEHALIIGVIGLGGNMFKPFTNTKTIVLFVQKRYKPLSEGQSFELGQNNIVYCVTEKPGKDKTGKIITGENGEIITISLE